jgi:hypothetical protein
MRICNLAHLLLLLCAAFHESYASKDIETLKFDLDEAKKNNIVNNKFGIRTMAMETQRQRQHQLLVFLPVNYVTISILIMSVH